MARLPFYGKAFLCIDDPNVCSILPLQHINTFKYGLSEQADLMGSIVELAKTQSFFDVYSNKIKNGIREKTKLGSITLNMSGDHMVLNALAAIAVCLELEVPFETIAHALENFGGVERRFEYKGMFRGVEIFDDYGHHPTEIRKTLTVAGRRKQNRLHVVFQPHRYSRTEKLWDDFVAVFARPGSDYSVDVLYITDIYPASEKPIANITSEVLVEAIKLKNPQMKVQYVTSYEHAVSLAPQALNSGDLLLTIGAGKVNKVGEMLVSMDSV